MVLEGYISEDYQLPVVVRRSLAEYLPRTAGHFKGVIASQDFQAKLRGILQRRYQDHDVIKGSITPSPIHPDTFSVMTSAGPYISNPGSTGPVFMSYKSAILKDVELETWLVAPEQRDLAEEYFKKSGQYLGKMGIDAANAVPNLLSKKAKKRIDKVYKKYVAHKVVHCANALTKNGNKAIRTAGYVAAKASQNKIAVGPTLFKNTRFEQSLWDCSVQDGLVGFGLENTLGQIDVDGVDVSLNNDVTRGWLTHVGMSEDAAFRTLDVLDTLSEFNLTASLTKSVESVAFNGYLSAVSFKDAIGFSINQFQWRNKWSNMNRQIKTDLKEDINALSDDELIDLYNFMTNNHSSANK